MKQRIATLLAGVLLAVAVFGVAAAGDFEDAMAAWKTGDYAKAMRLFRLLAEQGNPAAQDNLGHLYESDHGNGMPKDEAQAQAWFGKAFEGYRKAAEQGNADAQYQLGLMYDMGHAVPSKDDAQAVMWLRKAADQGNTDALTFLGHMYLWGEGVPQDPAQAAALYRKAAEQGDAEGQYVLSWMYDRGDGVPQDYVRAHMWINLAASRTSGASTRNSRIKVREELAAKMTPDQIAEAQRLAREWKPK